MTPSLDAMWMGLQISHLKKPAYTDIQKNVGLGRTGEKIGLEREPGLAYATTRQIVGAEPPLGLFFGR